MDEIKRIYLVGTINEEMFQRISEELALARENDQHVDLIVSSAGGNSYDARAIYDCIRSSQKSITIDTIATGYVASAAILPFLAGATRYATPSAWFMTHEDTTEITGDYKVTEAVKEMKHAQDLENQWNTLMASHTKLTASEWAGLHTSGDVYLNLNTAKKYGLFTEVI